MWTVKQSNIELCCSCILNCAQQGGKIHVDLKDIAVYIRNLKLSLWNLVKTMLASSVTIIINAMPFLSHVFTCQVKNDILCDTGSVVCQFTRL